MSLAVDLSQVVPALHQGLASSPHGATNGTACARDRDDVSTEAPSTVPLQSYEAQHPQQQQQQEEPSSPQFVTFTPQDISGDLSTPTLMAQQQQQPGSAREGGQQQQRAPVTSAHATTLQLSTDPASFLVSSRSRNNNPNKDDTAVCSTLPHTAVGTSVSSAGGGSKNFLTSSSSFLPSGGGSVGYFHNQLQGSTSVVGASPQDSLKHSQQQQQLKENTDKDDSTSYERSYMQQQQLFRPSSNYRLTQQQQQQQQQQQHPVSGSGSAAENTTIVPMYIAASPSIGSSLQQQQQQQQQPQQQQQQMALPSVVVGSGDTSSLHVMAHAPQRQRESNPTTTPQPSSWLPLPTTPCSYFAKGSCLRLNCHFFHGSAAELEKHVAEGAKFYRKQVDGTIEYCNEIPVVEASTTGDKNTDGESQEERQVISDGVVGALDKDNAGDNACGDATTNKDETSGVVSPPQVHQQQQVWTRKKKPIVCLSYLSGNCNRADCRFTHLPKHVRPVPPSACAYYHNGTCRRDNCRYFHGPVEELEALHRNGVTMYNPATNEGYEHVPLDLEEEAPPSSSLEEQPNSHTTPCTNVVVASVGQPPTNGATTTAAANTVTQQQQQQQQPTYYLLPAQPSSIFPSSSAHTPPTGGQQMSTASNAVPFYTTAVPMSMPPQQLLRPSASFSYSNNANCPTSGAANTSSGLEGGGPQFVFVSVPSSSQLQPLQVSSPSPFNNSNMVVAGGGGSMTSFPQVQVQQPQATMYQQQYATTTTSGTPQAQFFLPHQQSCNDVFHQHPHLQQSQGFGVPSSYLQSGTAGPHIQIQGPTGATYQQQQQKQKQKQQEQNRRFSMTSANSSQTTMPPQQAVFMQQQQQWH